MSLHGKRWNQGVKADHLTPVLLGKEDKMIPPFNGLTT